MSEPVLLAVISDVHGNRWALEAVLADIGRRGIGTIANLGDCLYGPLDPAGTARILMTTPMLTVGGNEDQILVDAGAGTDHAPSLGFTRERLSEAQLAWVAGLPRTVWAGRSILLCHGTPQRDDTYLLHAPTATGFRRRSANELERLLADIPASVVACGHDHVPATVEIAEGRLVVDPGSVGLPAYADLAPPAHVMESGSPHARYAVLSRTEEGWAVEHVSVAYDWHAAAQAAARHGRDDWAAWLASGRASA